MGSSEKKPSRMHELIKKIGGIDSELSPGQVRGGDQLSPEDKKGEVAAIKELGERLGMTGFEPSAEERERRQNEAREQGQEPGKYFGETSNSLSSEIHNLQKELQEVEKPLSARVVFPRQGEDRDAMLARMQNESQTKAKGIRSKLEQLNFDKSRADEIVSALEKGDTNLAKEELERQINQAERKLADTKSKISAAEQEVRYKNLMDFSRSAGESARQAQESGWADLAAVHQAAADLYAKNASELVGLDKLNEDKTNQSSNLKKFRAMVKNLDFYKK